MQAQRRRDTRLEMEIRRRLHARGLRYRVDLRPEPSLRCRGDIVFAGKKLVVFIDGCFWHACPEHLTLPKTNPAWWCQKLAANVARDGRNRSALKDLGWLVIQVWEHEPVETAVSRILDALDRKD